MTLNAFSSNLSQRMSCFIVYKKGLSRTGSREPVYRDPCQYLFISPRVIICPVVEFLIYPCEQGYRAVGKRITHSLRFRTWRWSSISEIAKGHLSYSCIPDLLCIILYPLPSLANQSLLASPFCSSSVYGVKACWTASRGLVESSGGLARTMLIWEAKQDSG